MKLSQFTVHMQEILRNLIMLTHIYVYVHSYSMIIMNM